MSTEQTFKAGDRVHYFDDPTDTGTVKHVWNRPLRYSVAWDREVYDPSSPAYSSYLLKLIEQPKPAPAFNVGDRVHYKDDDTDTGTITSLGTHGAYVKWDCEPHKPAYAGRYQDLVRIAPAPQVWVIVRGEHDGWKICGVVTSQAEADKIEHDSRFGSRDEQASVYGPFNPGEVATWRQAWNRD